MKLSTILISSIQVNYIKYNSGLPTTKPSFYYKHHFQVQFKRKFRSEFYKGIVVAGYIADVLDRRINIQY
jgi:hypothetical protein